MGLSSLSAPLAGESLSCPPLSQASLGRTAALSGNPCISPRALGSVRAGLWALELVGFWDLLWASLIQHALSCAVGLLLGPVRDAELGNTSRKYKLGHILTCVWVPKTEPRRAAEFGGGVIASRVDHKT